MESNKLTRVMLVDDHEFVLDGLREALQRTGEFEVVGQAKDGAAAVRVASQLKPDVIVLDVILPVKNGIDACREISETLPDTRVLVLTAATEEDAVMEAVSAGARGYVQKYSGMQELLGTVRDVANGKYCIPAEAMKRLLEGYRRAEEFQRARELEKLTVREREILTLFSKGLSYSEIAKARGVQPITIRNAIYGIQDKLESNSKQELVVWAMRNGLLDG